MSLKLTKSPETNNEFLIKVVVTLKNGETYNSNNEPISIN